MSFFSSIPLLRPLIKLPCSGRQINRGDCPDRSRACFTRKILFFPGMLDIIHECLDFWHPTPQGNLDIKFLEKFKDRVLKYSKAGRWPAPAAAPLSAQWPGKRLFIWWKISGRNSGKGMDKIFCYLPILPLMAFRVNTGFCPFSKWRKSTAGKAFWFENPGW